MNILKAKLVKLLGRAPEYVPDWSKPVLRPFSGVYSHIYKLAYSSIKEEELVRTPMGPYIYVRWWDCVERGCALGSWERKYMEIFCQKIKEGDVVVDVGAYIGVFSLLASERVGNKGCVYAFEPVPRNYERLMRNLKVNQVKNVKAYNLGLSDKNETLSFSVPRENPAESSLAGSWTELTKGIKLNKDMIKAKLIPFDQFCEDEGLNEVNIVKIDVDGAELKVLKGMRNVLTNSECELFVEITPPLIQQLGGTVMELVELLRECGFKFVYAVDLDRKIDISESNSLDLVNIFGNVSRNYIFTKEGVL